MAMRQFAQDSVVDGKLVICDEKGCPQLDRLGPRARLLKPESIREAANFDPAAIFAFDLLELDG